MSEIVIGMLLGLSVVLLVGLVLLVYAFAKVKIFFTTPREGSAEFVMKGNAVSRMIAVWERHHPGKIDIDSDGEDAYAKYEIEPDKDGPLPSRSYWRYLNPCNWFESLGIYWIGIWPFYQIYKYDFNWTGEKMDEKGNIVPYTRSAKKEGGTEEGQTSFVYTKDVNYFFFVNNVKTKGGVPLKFAFVVTIRIVNPYKALFKGANWLERTGGAINLITIRYAGNLEYDAIVASKPATLTIFNKEKGAEVEGLHSIENLIVMLGDGLPDDPIGQDLSIDYGVKIVAAKVHSIEFADAAVATEYSKHTTQKYVAEQKGLAMEAEATGEARAIGIRAEAERNRIETAYSPIAGTDKEARMKIRQLEALEKSGDKGGHTIVIPDDVLGLARTLTKK